MSKSQPLIIISPKLKLPLILTGAVLLAFAAGYLLAMQLVAHNVSAPFAPSPMPIIPGQGCHPSALSACPLIRVN